MFGYVVLVQHDVFLTSMHLCCRARLGLLEDARRAQIPPRGVVEGNRVDVLPVTPAGEHKHPIPPMRCPYLGGRNNTPLSIMPFLKTHKNVQYVFD